MFESIGNLLGAAKDKALEAAAKAYLNNKLAECGSVTSLELNTRVRKASVTAELKGESTPISVQIGCYEIVEVNDQMCIRILELSTNREWLTLAMKRYLVDKLMPIPSSLLSFLK